MKTHIVRLVCVLGVVFGLAFSAGAQQADGAFRFANIFNDNMVLQCDKPVRLWGWAKPGSEVTLTIEAEKPAPAASADAVKDSGQYSVTMTYVETNPPAFKTQQVTAKADASGKWLVTLKAMPAGFAPRVVRAKCDGAERTISNVLIGEVWVTSGQSNMTWGNYFAKPLIVPGAMYSGIRYFSVNDSWYKPLDDLKKRGQWTVCTPRTAGGFCAIPFLYAMYIHRYLKVPVGIVNNARGGTNGESWTSRADLEAIKDPVVNQDLADYDKQTSQWETEAGRAKAMADWREMCKQREAAYERKAADAKAKGRPVPAKPRAPRPPRDPRSGWSPPAGLYNAMVHPLKGLVVRGVLYYQGENEGNWTERWVQYEQVFPAVIDAFRETFEDPNLPFGIIGLAGWGSSNPIPEVECAWGRFAVIRDIQRRVHLRTPNTGYIAIYDLGNEFIHPNWKQPVGERAARWALAEVYGQTQIPHRGFQYKSMEVRGDKILLKFEKDPAMVKPGQTEKGPNWLELPSTRTGFNPKTMKYTGFVIAGKDRRWYPAQVRQNMDDMALEVWSDLVPHPVAVRYGWACWPRGNACSHQTRLPVPTFRTDDWPVPPNKAEAVRLEEIAKKQAEDRKLRTLLEDLEDSELSKQYAEQSPAYQKALKALLKAAADCREKSGTK